MSTHTPGPWYRTERSGSRRIVLMPDDRMEIRSEHGGTVAFLYGTSFDIDGKIDAANARLIAAAPEMLEALQILMAQKTMNPLDMTPTEREALWAAHAKTRAAIAKATGEASEKA